MTYQDIKHISTPELIARKIKQASSHMVVREFLENAKEASSYAEHPRVKWFEQVVFGCRKLAVWNNGRGMDFEELVRNMNLGQSGDEKKQGASANFGLGAKLTGLKANHAGLLWRSCKGGVVNELYLGWHCDKPRIIYQEGSPSPVIDCTHLYANMELAAFDRELWEASGKPKCNMLSFDWTMVIFLGNSLETQDTVIDPFGDGKPAGGTSYWLSSKINRRFYDLSNWKVSAICDLGDRGAQNRYCKGLGYVAVNEDEVVDVGGGVKVRYCLLAEGHASNEQAKGYKGHAALVFQNEIYDGAFDGTWTGTCSRFGVIAGGSRVAIHVLLPDDFPATPNEQRTLLEEDMPYGDRRIISLDEYEDVVEQNMPQFLCDFIAGEDQKRDRSFGNLEKRFKELMDQLGLRAPSSSSDSDEVSADEEGDESQPIIKRPPVNTDSHREATDRSPRARRPSFSGGKPAQSTLQKNLYRQPKVDWEPASGESRATIGQYDAKHHRILLYEDHPVLSDLIDLLIDDGVPDRYRGSDVRATAMQEIGFAAGRHVIFSLAQSNRLVWGEDQFKAATTPEAITASVGFAGTHFQATEPLVRHLKSK
jgi:hypothetical protein